MDKETERVALGVLDIVLIVCEVCCYIFTVISIIGVLTSPNFVKGVHFGHCFFWFAVYGVLCRMMRRLQ